MDWLLEYLEGFRAAVPAEPVRMSGAWAGKPQRRYASPTQLGTGEGPYVEVVDWRWYGAFESPLPLVGLAFLAAGERVYWVKSEPPGARPSVSFSAHEWAASDDTVSITGSFHGTVLPSVPFKFAKNRRPHASSERRQRPRVLRTSSRA